jgi:hypothetical protein
MLEPDPTGMIMDVMIFYTNSAASGNHTLYTPSNFEPDSWAVIVNSLSLAGLSTGPMNTVHWQAAQRKNRGTDESRKKTQDRLSVPSVRHHGPQPAT